MQLPGKGCGFKLQPNLRQYCSIWVKQQKLREIADGFTSKPRHKLDTYWMSAEQTHWFNNSMSLSNVQPPCDPRLMKHYLTSHFFNIHGWEGEKWGAQVTLILQAQESCQCLAGTRILSMSRRHKNPVNVSQAQESCQCLAGTRILSIS
jgi:hypothetical protein